MWDYVLSTAMLVQIGIFFYVVGFLFRDQIILRLLVLAGSMFYNAYYYWHGDAPQWEAMIGTSLIALANVIGLGQVVLSRYAVAIQHDFRVVYDALNGLEPGEFRQLMKIGELAHLGDTMTLTTEGRAPDKLCFVVGGRATVTKDRHSFSIDPRCFIGEVTFLLGGVASATVELGKGGVVAIWERQKLERLLQRKPRLKQAFEALLSKDMARKVSTSSGKGAAIAS
jgi:hypothetical protein